MFGKQTFKCPVCKDVLGKGTNSATEVLHCDECRAWIHFYPDDRPPKMILDKHAEKTRCGCGGCGR